MNPPPPTWQHKERIIHTQNQAFRKCFGCIHLRTGGALSSIVWAGLSFYFAVISFQSKSPFFSFLPSTAPFIVFGIVNLVLGSISLFLLKVLFVNHLHQLIFVVPAVFLGVGIVVIDAVINVILFITARGDYVRWCIGTAVDRLQPSDQVSNTGLDDRDFYNCNRSWEDELKFGILGTSMIVGFYIYWALCIRSYCFKREIHRRREGEFMPRPIPPLPHMAGHPPHGMPPPMRIDTGGPAMVVLHNQKPFKNESKPLSV